MNQFHGSFCGCIPSGYCSENSEAALGHAVKGFRDRILISTKCPIEAGMGADGYRKRLEKSLSRLGTDHVDFYHFWALNRNYYDNVVVNEGLLEAAAKAKEEGLIRHIPSRSMTCRKSSGTSWTPLRNGA